MAKTYFKKCGGTFQKSSTSGVTRYEDISDKCKDCSYIEHGRSYRGGKEVHITYCQAGSKLPCHKNEYSTTCDNDATTLSIFSLDMKFLNDVYIFASSQEGCINNPKNWPNVFHGLDKEDCRKSMPLSFENNKKGKAVKKTIIDKFFKELQQEKLDNCSKCFQCDGFQEEDQPSEYGKCTKKMTFIEKQKAACDKFNYNIQVHLSDEPLSTDNTDNPGASSLSIPQKLKKTELQDRNVTKRGIKFREFFYNSDFLSSLWKDRVLIRVVEGTPDKIEVYSEKDTGFLGYANKISDKYGNTVIDNNNDNSNTNSKKDNICPFYRSHKENEAFIQCENTVNVHHVGYMQLGDNGELKNLYFQNVCCGSYYACALYEEQKGERQQTCITCPNRIYVEGSRGEKVICPVTGAENEGHNPVTVCEWHNKLYNPPENMNVVTKECTHHDWPSQNCIDCEYCIDRQCSQGVFKNTSMVEISDGTKACPWFKQKQPVQEIPECPYYGGYSPDGSKFKIKCGDNHYLMFEGKEKLQEHIEYCKTGYKSCRAYTRCELKRLGIDLGPASPQKTEHLIDLLQIVVSKAAACPNCKNLGAYDYDGYNEEEGTFVWSCKLDQMEAASGSVCKNYERSLLAVRLLPAGADQKVIDQEPAKCLDCIFCRRAGNAIDHPAPYKCFNNEHRGGLDWYFTVNSLACGNFKKSDLSCGNCQGDKIKCGGMFPEGCHDKNGVICKQHSSYIVILKEDKVVNSESADICQGCKNSKNDKCSIKGIKGGALVYFVMDDDVPDCDTIQKLKVDYLSGERKCGHAHTGCTAVSRLCSMKGEYCCYTCKQPCNSYCSYSKELVPYGLLRNEDKGLVQVSSSEPAYIYLMETDTKDEQTAALNSHLQYIRKKSEDIVGNYVEIGFVIINIRDNELYKAKGYGNHIECVEAELNMKKSTAYNLIKISEKFGDPETKLLKSEYSQYNYVQCLEMSTMTKEELALTSPDMSKREMQELKKSNRLEKSKDENTKESKTTVPLGNGLAQLIEGTGSSVIDVTEYKVCDNGNKRIQEQPGQVHSEVCTAAHGQEDNNHSFHCKEPVKIQDTDPEEDPQNETGTDRKPVIDEHPQPGAADKNDMLINKLLLENDEYKQRADALQHDKDTLRELVSQIDSKFDKLSKKQIRNALWDFINTGMIMLEENL